MSFCTLPTYFPLSQERAPLATQSLVLAKIRPRSGEYYIIRRGRFPVSFLLAPLAPARALLVRAVVRLSP